MTAKPDLTRIWASGAIPADLIDPDTTTPGKFASGWVVEVPIYEHFNFLQNFFTSGLAHMNEEGISVWDTDTSYPIDGIAKGSDGNLYRALVAQSGNNPTVSATNWQRVLLGNVPSTNSTALGESSGIALSTGARNVLLGRASGTSLDTGDNNVGIGNDAIFNLVVGDDNTAMGYQALLTYTGSDSVGIGSQAAELQELNPITAIGTNALRVSTGTANTAVGYLAGDGMLTASNNTAIGHAALSAVSGANCTAVGANALTASTGINNTAVGYDAGSGITVGVRNTAIGKSSMTGASGGDCTAVGYAALEVSTGLYNTAVGAWCGDGIITGASCTAMGYLALSNLSADDCTAVGRSALQNSQGTDNTAVGAYAGDGITTAVRNTAVGKSALSGVLVAGVGDDNTVVGSAALQIGTGRNNTIMGSGSAAALTTPSNNTAYGYSSLGSATTGKNNTAIGRQALGAGNLLDTTGDDNVAVGFNALLNCTGTDNTSVGSQSGDGLTSGNRNTSMGKSSLSATLASGTGDDNTAIGYNALQVCTSTDNVAVGSAAGSGLISAVQNTAIGRAALNGVAGNSNTAVGFNAMLVATGAGNTAVGALAGNALTSGSNNTYLGAYTGSSHTTLSNRVILSDGAGNICFEADASQNATFAGSVTAGATIIDDNGYILREGTASALTLSGGNATAAGGNIQLFGNTHSTLANDILFRSQSSQVGLYDNSATRWIFNGDVSIDAASSLYFDGGGDTYITESSADTLDIYVGNTNVIKATTAGINLSDNELERPLITDYGIAHGTNTVTANAVTVTYSTNQSSFIDLQDSSASTAITLSGGPVSGDYGEMQLYVQQHSTVPQAVTFAGGTFHWPNGAQPVQSTGADAVDIYHFSTFDGGTNWYATVSRGH